jgi:hypothetical protein
VLERVLARSAERERDLVGERRARDRDALDHGAADHGERGRRDRVTACFNGDLAGVHVEVLLSQRSIR